MNQKVNNINSFKKAGFPVGIFLLVFLVESLVGAGALIFHFHRTVTGQIDIATDYIKNYSITLSNAFADVCELSYKKKNYTIARKLFHDKIRKGTVDEAFFVLSNGKIILHSMTKKAREMKGNIANDEFYYNLDLILKQATKKKRTVLFSPYYLINREIPFTRRQKEFLKKYIYSDINKNGWLVSRAVFHKGRPVGTVNFLIGKEMVYQTILSKAQWTKKAAWYTGALIFVISLSLSIFVFIRYRMLQNKALMASSMGDDVIGDDIEHFDEYDIHEVGLFHDEGFSNVIEKTATVDMAEESIGELHDIKKGNDAIPSDNELLDDDDIIDIEILGSVDPGDSYKELSPVGGSQREILDAIPVVRKER